MIHEVTTERGPGRPYFHVVDVAVQGLLQTEDELRHTQNLQPRFLEWLEIRT
jgi:hypothetical protein